MDGYQRRTQKGMGRTQKTGHTGTAKNPRLVKRCNTTWLSSDIDVVFFISVINLIDLKWFNTTKKNNFLKEGQFLSVNLVRTM